MGKRANHFRIWANFQSMDRNRLMNLWDYARDPANVLLLLEFGAERGVPQSQLLNRSSLSIARLHSTDFEPSAMQELRVQANLLRALGHPPALGLEIGRRARLSSFGLWGYGLVCSPTLGAALDMALRFLPLTHAYCVIDRHERGDEVILTFGPPNLPAELRRFNVEGDMAGAASLLAELGGPTFELTSFHLKGGRGRLYSRPAHVPAIAGVVPRFDADDYSISLKRRHLDRKLPNDNPGTVALCEQLCAQLIEKRRVRLGSTASFIREYLATSASHALPSLATFARLTNTSERTLKRRLSQEGTSLRAISTEYQSAAAAALVRDSDLSLTLIAERLGYADLSSFSQAFKRWHGVSPAQYRSKS